MFAASVILICILTSVVWTLENGLARTPPMGWLTWERFRCTTDCQTFPNECISENLIKRTVDALVRDGYKDAGYEYVIIDDCWAEVKRSSEGLLIANRLRFPNGMKALADYIFTTKFNLGFGSVKKDTCNDCLAFSTKFKAATDIKIKKTLIVERLVHLHKANKFFSCLNATPPRTISINFDLMQNQPQPRTQINQAYYSRQLWYYVLGLIIHTPTKVLNPDTVHFYRWLEVDGGRGCDEISSCLWDFFVKIVRPMCVAENIECIRMFSDSCVGQNRNYCVLSMFAVIASQFGLKVEWFFPVRGHSYMPADRAFGLVETQLRDIDLILLPEDYDKVFSQFGTVHVLGLDFPWLNWQDVSKKTTAVKKSFKISKAKKISVYPKSGMIGTRENYMEPLCKHTILKKGKRYRDMILSLTEKDRKSHVTEKKKQDIIKLLKVMGYEPVKIPFYKEALELKEDDTPTDSVDYDDDKHSSDTSATDSE